MARKKFPQKLFIRRICSEKKNAYYKFNISFEIKMDSEGFDETSTPFYVIR